MQHVCTILVRGLVELKIINSVIPLAYRSRYVPLTVIVMERKIHKFRVCVCVFSSHSFWTSMDVPAGVPGSHRKKVTQDSPSTFFLRCLP